MNKTKLMLGDNILSLRKLPENSIDSVVTDPPYGLSFMNKKWDYEVPSVEFWKEVYRVLKPGGHILSFGGTRTYHRMVINIEDAGFEIRDQMQWLYGSGFPKSMNIGKAYDKKNGNEREVIGEKNADNFNNPILKEQGSMMGSPGNRTQTNIDITKGTSQYEGLGTGLKPANEPICLARKPISEKTILDNVIKWGTGGLNIDGSRIECGKEHFRSSTIDSKRSKNFNSNKDIIPSNNELGRFPANLILDEEAGELLDTQSGIGKSSIFPGKGGRGFGAEKNSYKNHKDGGSLVFKDSGYTDKGGASRFFYCPKVSKQERNLGLDLFEDKTIHNDGNKFGIDKFNTKPKKNYHPTIKPINLMTYLIKLINPNNGIVLDPFMGSGSTGIASQLLGFKFCGMEMQEDYFKIAEERIKNFELYRKFIK